MRRYNTTVSVREDEGGYHDIEIDDIKSVERRDDGKALIILKNGECVRSSQAPSDIEWSVKYIRKTFNDEVREAEGEAASYSRHCDSEWGHFEEVQMRDALTRNLKP